MSVEEVAVAESVCPPGLPLSSRRPPRLSSAFPYSLQTSTYEPWSIPEDILNAISEKMMIHEADFNGGQSILRARLGLTAKGELSFVEYLPKVSQSGPFSLKPPLRSIIISSFW